MILPPERLPANITGIWPFISMCPFMYQQIVRFGKLSMAVFANKLLLWSRSGSSCCFGWLPRSPPRRMQLLQIHRRVITPGRLVIQSGIPDPLVHQNGRVRSRRRQAHISSQRRVVRVRRMGNFGGFVLEQVLVVRRFVVHEWMRRGWYGRHLGRRLWVLVVHPRVVLLGHTVLLGHLRFLVHVLDCWVTCFWGSWGCWEGGTSRLAFYTAWRYCWFVICGNSYCYRKLYG